MNLSEYRELLKSKVEYALFVDGAKLIVVKRCPGRKPEEADLTQAEFNLLWDYMCTGYKMTPGQTEHGKKLDAADKAFASARKKADYRLSRYETRFFKTHRGSIKESRAAYQFCPQDGLRSCIIKPLEPPQTP